MKKKHLIGAAVLSLALFASCTMPVISTRERVLASQAQDQDVLDKSDITLSPAGYSTVKGSLTNKAKTLWDSTEKRKKYKYCWVANTTSLPDDSDGAWKDLPHLAGELNQNTDASDPFMLFEGAEPNKYLVVKKTTDEKKVVYTSDKITYTKATFNATPSIYYSKKDSNSGSYRMPFEGSGDTLEYRLKLQNEPDSDYDKGVWKQGTVNGISISLTSTDQPNVSYYVRKKATENTFASKPITVKITNLNSDGKINFDVIKALTYKFENGQLSISELRSLQGKDSKLFYSEVDARGDVSPESTPIRYGENQNNSLTISNVDGIAIQSDGIIILSFVFHKDRKFDDDEKGTIKQKEKSLQIIGLKEDVLYEYKKENENDREYKAVSARSTTLTVADYGTYYIRKKGSEKDFTIGDRDVSKNLHRPSEPLKIIVTDKDPAPALPPLIYYPDLFEPQVNGEEAKKAEETKKEEEAKKAEEAKQAEEAKKAEEAKQAEEAKKAEEAKQTEEIKKPALQSVQAKKKTGATVSSEKIEAVLNADSGKLTITTKNAEVSLSKKVLDAVFGFEAEPLKVSVKTEVLKKDSKEERTIAKNKGQLVSKDVYHLSVKVGKDSLNDYDLQGGKLVVTLKTNLKTAPKKLYVMNLATGKKVKASFKAGKVSFKSDIEGKFVLVTK